VQTAINWYVFFRVFPRRQPWQRDLTEGSDPSAKLNLTQGKYPKENIQVSEHGENLKSSIVSFPHVLATFVAMLREVRYGGNITKAQNHAQI
jgi:hypothetical protein